MPLRFSDSPQARVYRVVCRNYLRDGRVQLDTWNVWASAPIAASEWVLTHKACGLSSTILVSRKLKYQPVWLKKIGDWEYRFDLRKREIFRPTPL